MNSVALRPSYWAAVSGGKDSLFMLHTILHNLDKYPLDGVVHFELEIDYPFIHEVIDYMEKECGRFGIPFVRLKPRKSWEELYNKNGFPTRAMRWCTDHYKLDCKRQLDEWLKYRGFYTISYIGYCVDEEKRYTKRTSLDRVERYPLVEEGVSEDFILEWAKKQPIFNHFYEVNRRCGCMFCPLASMINRAYLCKFYPNEYRYMIEKMRETEHRLTLRYGRPISVISSNPKYNAAYLDYIIKTKWLKKLDDKLDASRKGVGR